MERSTEAFASPTDRAHDMAVLLASTDPASPSFATMADAVRDIGAREERAVTSAITSAMPRDIGSGRTALGDATRVLVSVAADMEPRDEVRTGILGAVARALGGRRADARAGPRRIDQGEPAVSAALRGVAAARDLLRREISVLEAGARRIADGLDDLDRIAATADGVARSLEDLAVTGEKAHARAALLEMTPVLTERRMRMAETRAEGERARCALDLIADGNDAVLRAADATATATGSALRMAVEAARAARGGEALAADAIALASVVERTANAPAPGRPTNRIEDGPVAPPSETMRRAFANIRASAERVVDEEKARGRAVRRELGILRERAA